VLVAVALSGCGTISSKFSEVASQAPGIGLPADAPERTAQQAAYPAVHDMPPPRNTDMMTAIERTDAERELLKARTEQQGIGAAIRAGADDPRDVKEKEEEARARAKAEKERADREKAARAKRRKPPASQGQASQAQASQAQASQAQASQSPANQDRVSQNR
jgi:hypothetical protein